MKTSEFFGGLVGVAVFGFLIYQNVSGCVPRSWEDEEFLTRHFEKACVAIEDVTGERFGAAKPRFRVAEADQVMQRPDVSFTPQEVC